MIKTAMILDDEAPVVSSLRRLLKRHGWHVVTYTDPVEAFNHLRYSFVPVIITDFNMPRLNGTQFLQLVEKIQPATYKIMLSAHAERGDIVKTLSSAGIHRFMSKPWDNNLLMEEMDAGLEYFRLQLKAEYEQNKAILNADDFKAWYDDLLLRMQSTGSQRQRDKEAWLGIG
ncbi:response regulator [Pontibacterium granulatum]|uniref:response regulator n=1 Tax=Pontibacterium granulatum TaxID=2036029 RepID=UPI002499DBCA|nr:response regulator [Pontibacterium granulatum]MDI3324955.1 response regulator [Pontibacterium granulatum]